MSAAKIEFSAREPHFVDHLAPVWYALPEDLRGRFLVGPDAVAAAERHRLPAVVASPLTSPSSAPIVVAAWGDLKLVRLQRRQIILMEHGAGQSYSSRHRSYVGGHGRERVSLIMVPSIQAMRRSRRWWPNHPHAVIGCPKLDRLVTKRRKRRSSPPTVAVTWHWRCQVAPEAGTAFDHMGPGVLDRLVKMRDAGEIRLVGHAHPRMLESIRHHYTERGIPVLGTADDVMRTADLLVVDNSSILFEFAALDRPVVLVNSPKWRRDVNHGLRFWSEADIGPHIDHPRQTRRVVLDALTNHPSQVAARRAAVQRVYAHLDGTAAEAAARAILGHLHIRYRPPTE